MSFTRGCVQDPSLDCDSTRHRLNEIYAGIFIAIIPIFTPLAFFYLLWRAREGINPGDAASELEAITLRTRNSTLAPLQILFSMYKPSLWFWECVDLTRRIVMVRGRAPRRHSHRFGLALATWAFHGAPHRRGSLPAPKVPTEPRGANTRAGPRPIGRQTNKGGGRTPPRPEPTVK